MEFRAPIVIKQQNAQALIGLTENLREPDVGQIQVLRLLQDLGNAVDFYPDWHPILTAPLRHGTKHISDLSQLAIYQEIDHTTKFVRGFVTCPYSDAAADRLVDTVNQVPGLRASRLEEPLYADNAYPVIVEAINVELEADGTIRSRDALAWFAQQISSEATSAQVAETWWNIRSNILGGPHGSRSSLFVNQYTGVHMRKILDAMNNSGMFGPIKESSLEMLSQKKRDAVSKTLIRAAVENWDRKSVSFNFEMRGETCKASVRDTWNDNSELSVRVNICEFDLSVSGFFYPEGDKITHVDPIGKRGLAEKFL